jgi:hypothetical protein
MHYLQNKLRRDPEPKTSKDVSTSVRVRIFVCDGCGHAEHRDLNAPHNLLSWRFLDCPDLREYLFEQPIVFTTRNNAVARINRVNQPVN